MRQTCPKCNCIVNTELHKCESKELDFSQIPMINVVALKPYFDEHLGEYITSYDQRKRLMKAKGYVDGRSDWDGTIVRQKKEQADKLGISVTELEHRFSRQAIT